MSAIPGSVRVTGVLAPTDTSDTYPVTDPVYGIDGLRSVADHAERNAISNDRRRAGMLVYTGDTRRYWKLVDGPWTGTDSDWMLFYSGMGQYVHNQRSPQTVWVINHGRGDFPPVTVVTSGGDEIVGSVKYFDSGTLTVTFSAALSGTAYLG